MIKRDASKSFNFALNALGVLPATILEWNKTLAGLDFKDLKIVEFNPELVQNERWALLIEPRSEEGKKRNTNIKYFNRLLNRDLHNAFVKSGNEVSENWDKLFSDIDLVGFYIPVNDIKRVNPSVLKSHLYFYQLLIKFFEYKDFFTALRKEKRKRDEVENRVPYAIWLYIYFYSRFLHRLKAYSINIYQEYSNWYTVQLDLNDFHCRLPSEQLTIILLNQCESIVSNTEHLWTKNNFFSIGIPEVNLFFQKYKSDLNFVFTKDLNDPNNDFLEKTFDKLIAGCDAIFKLDHDELLLQDILDNQSNLALSSYLPLLFQLKYGPNSLYNVSNVIKDKLLHGYERPIGEFKEHDEALPNYKEKNHKTYIKNVQYWYEMMPDEKENIINLIRTNAINHVLKGSSQYVISRSQNSWVNLINLISSPILTWNIKGKDLLPQWNLFEDGEVKDLREVFKKSKIRKSNEKRVLEQHLKAIFMLDSLIEIETYIFKNKPVFSYDEYQNKWQEELNRVVLRLEQKEKFYALRMKEFGIIDSNLGDVQKSIWLKEMLAIEDEVKPYIQFVKQAFQTALPIRNKTVFSLDRHVSDGVEFDPDTLYDQEKWIRADVMKVMESKVERGEAVQINTFCLDYSGSMKHDRMRNLYKTLYLLVLGLEDRKSYDAFHFFSNNFIEVVNFSDAFTNRKVLFRIMQQISKIEVGKVHYQGAGATNISEGINKSHLKMKTFVNDFISKNPKVNVVTSMFVITDGVPSVGITDIQLLNEFINEKREDGDVEIKGIFIKSEDDVSPNFMNEIFGENNYIETTDFQAGVNNFVRIMTETYKKQRKTYKWKMKKLKLGITK